MTRTLVNPELKETVTFIKTAAETNGEVSDLEISLLPGGGNPLHYHTTYTENFTALSGALYLQLKGKQAIKLNPGESYLVRKGEVHRFFNPGKEDIKFRNEVRPGHKGFEDTLRILCGLAADGQYNSKGLPKHIAHLAICGMMSDMRLPGLMSLTTPVFKTIAIIARRIGVEKQLMNRYCS